MSDPIDRGPQLHAYFDSHVSWAPVGDNLPQLGGKTGLDPLAGSDESIVVEAKGGTSAYFVGTEMPDRDWWEALWPDPEGVLRKVGVTSGSRAVDLCCGYGYFTAPLSRIVAGGHVVAVDLSPVLLDAARREVEARGGTNVDFLLADARELSKRVSEPVDFVLLANTLHGVEDKTAMCEAIRSVLRREGRLAVVSWHARPREETTVLGSPRGPRTELRMSPSQTRAVVEPSGFRESAIVDLPPHHYGAIFDAL